MAKHPIRRKASFLGAWLVLAAAVVVTTSLAPSPAHASPVAVTWTGAGDDNNWTTAANWVSGAAPVVPVAGDELTFPSGAAQLSSFNDFASGTSFASITITGSGYDLTGNQLALSLINADYPAGSSTISMDLVMVGNLVAVQQYNTDVVLSGTVSGSAGLFKAGSGRLTLAHDNTFTGQVQIPSGVVRIEAPLALGAVGAGDDTVVLPSTSLELAGSIDVAESISLNGDGTAADVGALHSASGDNTVHDLTLTDNTIISAAAATTLRIAGTVSESGGQFALTTVGPGPVSFDGAATYGNGTVVSSGTLVVTETLASWVSVLDGATLAFAGGNTGDVFAYGATVTASYGGLASTGVVSDLHLDSASTFATVISGPATGGGAGYSQIVSDGGAILANPALNVMLTGGFQPTRGEVFRIISTSNPVDGTFAGLADGAMFPVGSTKFRINYDNTGVILTAIGAATTMTLTSSPNPSATDSPATFTATVTGDGATPTGSVAFSSDSVVLGSGSVALVNGVATLTTSQLWHGNDTVDAVYSGDSLYLSNSTSSSHTVNRTPIAGDDYYSTDEDIFLYVGGCCGGMLGNDTDPDYDYFTPELAVQAAHGLVTFYLDGIFRYVPSENFNGSDSFTYVVNDGYTTSAPATVFLYVAPVDDPPVANADTYATTEDTTVTIDAAAGVLANDTDTEGAAMSAAVSSGVSHGSLTFNTGGSFTYIPDADYNGPDAFSYTATDGTSSTVPTWVTLNVSAVDDAPVAEDDSYTVAQDGWLEIAAPGVMANDSNPDGDPTRIVWGMTDPTQGWMMLNVDGSFVYSPNPGASGTDSFQYFIEDEDTRGNVATVLITINATPTAVADSYTTLEDTTLTVASPGVLGNDTDPEHDALSTTIVDDVDHGTLTFNADGSFSYVPVANFSGSDSFTYVANDGWSASAPVTVTIDVTAVRDTPVAGTDVYSTLEDTTLDTGAAPSASVLGNDTDADGDTLSAVLASTTAHGTLALVADGTFTYTPDANFAGSDEFYYRAFDGTVSSGSTRVSITVGAVNDAPVGAADYFEMSAGEGLWRDAPGVLGNDTDADGETLTSTLGTGPADGTLTFNADGSFLYVPDAGFAGNDTFTYFAHDGDVAGNETTVSINVYGPPAGTDDTYATDEDTDLVVAAPGVLGNDTDPNGWQLSATLVSGPSHGSLTLDADGSFMFSPDANFHGADSFVYEDTNGAFQSAQVTVTLTINSVNDTPTAPPVAPTATPNNAPLVVAAPGPLAGATDADGDPLTAVLVTGPSNGTVVLNPDGSYIYTPSAGFAGSDSFVYAASDGTELSAPVTITVNVAAAVPPTTPEPSPTTTPTGTDTQTITVTAPTTTRPPTTTQPPATTQSPPTANGPAAGAVEVVSVGPKRVFDTRPGQSLDALRQVSKIPIGGPLELQVQMTDLAGYVPASGVGAVSLNVTSNGATADGYITVYACGTREVVSSVNFTAGHTVANAVITPVSPSGAVCFYATTPTDVVVDINGWFATGAAFSAVGPKRVFDTRTDSGSTVLRNVAATQIPAGGTLEVQLTDLPGYVPAAGVAAVSLNVVVTNPGGSGFITVYACGARALVSSVNYVAGQTVANAVIAPVSASGTVCFYSLQATDLIVDINGWLATGSEFHAIDPARVADTRPSQSPDALRDVTESRIGGATMLEIRVADLVGRVPAVGVSAVSLNVTATNPDGAGYITVFACGTREVVSSVNFDAGATVANAVLAPVSANGTICLYSNVTTDVIVDINGWIGRT